MLVAPWAFEGFSCAVACVTACVLLAPYYNSGMKISEAQSPEELAEAAAELDPTTIDSFELVTPLALAGSYEACSSFVRYLQLFVDEVAAEIDPYGQLRESGYRQTLLLRGLSAPMTGWVGSFGFGRGVGASIAASALELTSVSSPIAVPAGLAPEVASADLYEFERMVLATLRSEDEPLAVIGRELQLTKAELGELFRVSRQAVSEWMDTGIPPKRLGDVSHVLRIASLLSRKLKPGRAALVVRRPAPALGGRTLLEVIHDDPAKALSAVEESFDWSGVA